MKTKTQKADEAFEKAIEEMQATSEKNGNCNLTLDEINEIIRLARDERKKK